MIRCYTVLSDEKKEAIISLILSRDWANTLRRYLNKDLDYRWTDSPCTDKLCIKHFPSVTASSHDKDLQIQAVVNKYPWLKGNLWVQRVSGKRKTKQPLGCCWLVADKLPSGWCNKLGLTKGMYVCVWQCAQALMPQKDWISGVFGSMHLACVCTGDYILPAVCVCMYTMSHKSYWVCF